MIMINDRIFKDYDIVLVVVNTGENMFYHLSKAHDVL